MNAYAFNMLLRYLPLFAIFSQFNPNILTYSHCHGSMLIHFVSYINWLSFVVVPHSNSQDIFLVYILFVSYNNLI